MNLQKVKEIAKDKGVKIGSLKKSELVQAIQSMEGNESCYNTGKSVECGQENCLWRDDCK
ncbi:MAG: SAP domain-containing protein [Geobacter sp.]|nr:SAP domain-containing protein [Geobacter sp.]